MKLKTWFYVKEITYKKIGNQSYNRTKKWLIENHPELLI
jgi:hypothetical protein